LGNTNINSADIRNFAEFVINQPNINPSEHMQEIIYKGMKKIYSEITLPKSLPNSPLRLMKNNETAAPKLKTCYRNTKNITNFNNATINDRFDLANTSVKTVNRPRLLVQYRSVKKLGVMTVKKEIPRKKILMRTYKDKALTPGV